MTRPWIARTAAAVACAVVVGVVARGQGALVGYAVDGAAGTAAQIDPRTFRAGRPTRVLTAAIGGVVARATDRALYVLDQDRGRVVVVDPGTMAVRRGGDVSVAERVASSVVDGDGRLWLLGRTSGDVIWFDGPERHRRAGVVSRPAGAELLVAGGAPVVVDEAARTLRRLGASGRVSGQACIEMDGADDSVRFGGAERGDLVYVVSGAQGALRVSDLGSGDCAGVTLPVARPA